MREIVIAAAAILHSDGKTLLVRKRGTSAYMQPGGKIDAGETPDIALRRELQEELSFTLTADAALYIGKYSALAANEDGFTVTADIYLVRHDGPFHPSAEIEDAVWVDPSDTGQLTLAPLTRDHVLPHLRSINPVQARL